MIRGSSGAIITVYSEHVTKTDPVRSRTRLQGEWLMQHQSVLLPKVTQLIPYGYDMERLTPAPAWALDHMEILHAMLDGLSRRMWDRPAVVRYDLDVTLRKVRDIAEKNDIDDDVMSVLNDLALELDWDELTACLTHGDVTFDNVMFRGDQLVLIDPIPATITTGVPDLWSADMGHILRSVLGFEAARYDDDSQRFRITPKQLRFHIDDDHEWAATVFWACVHLLRTLPYLPSDNVREMIRRLVNDAIGLL